MLEEIQSRLVKVAAFNREELKPQAVFRANDNRRNKLSALEIKLQSYER